MYCFNPKKIVDSVDQLENETEEYKRMNALCVLSPHSPVVHSPTAYSTWKRNPPMENPVFYFGGHTLRFSEGCQLFPSYQTTVSSFDFHPSLSGNLSPLKALAATSQEGETEDKNTVFVAGATGRVGSRAVRELLKLGFRVRAAVRSTQRTEALVDSVQPTSCDGVAGNPEIQSIQNLEIVTCDLENQVSIGPAIGISSVVLCSIGASEKEFLDITGPYRIDYRATKNLIDAATAAKVKHFILVTSLGTHKIGFPASLLNLFWGVLIWKRKAEEHLIASGIPYTIVRPGGMERPTDSFKETHNLVLANEDTYYGGLVSNLQVAELIATIVKNSKLSVYKVIEVIAKRTAPQKPIEELLSQIRGRKEILDENGAGSESFIQSESTLFRDETFSRKKTPKAKPLSPYFMYADFKPPTSPTPTPRETRVSSKATGHIEAEQKLESIISPVPGHKIMEKETASSNDCPLSPYTAYEDLKPPTSPIPTPSSSYGGPRIGPIVRIHYRRHRHRSWSSLNCPNYLGESSYFQKCHVKSYQRIPKLSFEGTYLHRHRELFQKSFKVLLRRSIFPRRYPSGVEDIHQRLKTSFLFEHHL